jgi:hypothetical protein
MPHFPKPFFKKNRRLWYVEIDRRQHNLGPDKDEAFRQYHQLMTRPPRRIVRSPRRNRRCVSRMGAEERRCGHLPAR